MKFIQYFFIFLLLLSPSLAYGGVIGGDLLVAPPGTIDLGGDSFSTIIARIIRYAIAIAGILAVIGITWGGIQMVTAVGEDEKFKKARYMMIYSLIGVLIAGLAYWVVGIISSLRF